VFHVSNEALGWAFKQDLPTSAKFVLVVLADHADENASCFPSQKKIARMTGMGERSVRRWLEWLEEQNVVTRSSRYGENGRRTTDRYRLNLAANLTTGQSGRPQPPAETTTGQIDQWSDSTGSTPAMVTGGQIGRPARPAETTTGQIDHRSDLQSSPATVAGHEPSENPQISLSQRETADRAETVTVGPIPPDFTLSDRMRAWAAEHAPGIDPEAQTDAFVDYWLAKGEHRADWAASWRGWMRNRARWDAQHRQAPATPGVQSGLQPFQTPRYSDNPDPWA
jgi:hypothetical protein